MYTHSTAKGEKSSGNNEPEEEGTKNLLKVDEAKEEKNKPKEKNDCIFLKALSIII